MLGDADAEKKWLETKIPRVKNGKVVNGEDYWAGGDLKAARWRNLHVSLLLVSVGFLLSSAHELSFVAF